MASADAFGGGVGGMLFCYKYKNARFGDNRVLLAGQLLANVTHGAQKITIWMGIAGFSP